MFSVPCNNGISGVIRTEPSQETSTFHARAAHRIPGETKINSCQVVGRDKHWLCTMANCWIFWQNPEVWHVKKALSSIISCDIRPLILGIPKPLKKMFLGNRLNKRFFSAKKPAFLVYLQWQPFYDPVRTHVTRTVHVIFFIELVVCQRWSRPGFPKMDNKETHKLVAIATVCTAFASLGMLIQHQTPSNLDYLLFRKRYVHNVCLACEGRQENEFPVLCTK